MEQKFAAAEEYRGRRMVAQTHAYYYIVGEIESASDFSVEILSFSLV